MRAPSLSVAIITSLLISQSRPAHAAEPLADKVRDTMRNGVEYLKKKQENRGGEWNWENTEFLNSMWSGGTSCLATLALLNCGEKPSSPHIQRALPYIRTLKPTQTYVIALQSMVLAEVGEARDLNIIQNNTNLLLGSRMYNNKKLVGWSYGKSGHVQPDNSNTQYALLGLLAGRQAGVKIDESDWREIQDFFMSSQDKSQKDNGGWPYRPEQGAPSTHSMTVAGLCGLYISGLELNVGKQKLNEKTGIAEDCGKYDENESIARGMNWLSKHFKFDVAKETHRAAFYNVYGIERVGRLSGQRFIGEHDWYREGCELLCGVKKSDGLAQGDDGSWKMGNGIDNMPVISTSFALLFLSKGRTPVLISKLAFDGVDGTRHDWNRKHHDARHLVEYASTNIFKKQPLGWQIFDPRLADLSTEAKMNEELTSLLQSPILYMNGHAAPKLTDQQIILLRHFVDEGGFIFAEACCGSPQFAAGFRDLMAKVFNKEAGLTTLRPEHPVWTAHLPLDPSEFMTGRKESELIQCIERGCKTVAIFSPQPLAGYWEESRFMPRNNLPPEKRSEYAYRFAGNVIAYATGLELPKPKLSEIKLTDRNEEKGVTRHMLKIAQLDYGGDWQPAPQAMRTLATHMREQFKLDVALNKEIVRIGRAEDLMQHKFMYMHGRGQFTIDPEDIRNMRNNLRTGGTLFADACCGAAAFDKSFREFVKTLYPNGKLERIPLDDFLYSEKLSGRAITTVKCRREKADGSPATEYEDMAPELEGVKVGNRWVIIYSKYDIGCALEKAKSSACKGHDHESAKLLGAAAVLYSLKR